MPFISQPNLAFPWAMRDKQLYEAGAVTRRHNVLMSVMMNPQYSQKKRVDVVRRVCECWNRMDEIYFRRAGLEAPVHPREDWTDSDEDASDAAAFDWGEGIMAEFFVHYGEPETLDLVAILMPPERPFSPTDAGQRESTTA